MALIDKVSDFIRFPKSYSKLSPEEASSLYIQNGGILKAEAGKLIFPGRERIRSQLGEAMNRKENLTSQLRFWQRQHRSVSPDNIFGDFYRAADPLFWEHLFKLGTERKYRRHFEKVDLPMKYMHEEKYRKIIRAFVRDDEYRKKLVKAKTSIVGRTSSITENAEKGREFKRKIVEDNLSKIKEDRDHFQARIKVLEALLEWSSRDEIE